jgi:hypothetical protein
LSGVFLAFLFFAAQAGAADDPRGEIRGRIVDAASGAPLKGAVVVANWQTALPPNPAALLMAPLGHGPGTTLRTARVAETLSATDGSFALPAFTQEEQINQGPIVFNRGFAIAFLPGYEPEFAGGGETRVYRYGTKPGRPSTVENLARLRDWLDDNIEKADGEGVAAPTRRVLQPGQRVPGESRRQELARSGQLTAMRTVREELARLAPPRPQAEPRGTIIELPPEKQKPGIERLEVSPAPAPQGNPYRPGDPSPGPYITPSATPQADAERAFREGKRMPLFTPVCGYTPPFGCASAARYSEEYNRTLQELARRK